MKKYLIIVLAAAALILTGCGDTSTGELLEGKFLPDDTSVPNILGPADGAQVIDAKLDTDAVEVLLSWTGKSGARSYSVEVFSDAAMTAHIQGSPFSVPAPETSVIIEVPYAGTYYWRVRSSVTAEGLYSEARSFKAWEDCLYVYFAYNPANPTARPDDSQATGRDGTLNRPFQSINRAMADAYRLGISKVRVATRGEITEGSGNFAAYEEYFIFQPGVSLYGGYLYQNPEGGTPGMTRATGFPENLENNPYETRLEGRFTDPITIKYIYTPMVIDGIAIRATNRNALEINYCGSELVLRHCVLMSTITSESRMSLYIKYSDPLIENNYFTVDNSRRCIIIENGTPIIRGNTMVMNDNLGPSICVLISAANPVLMNNAIVGANVTSSGVDSSAISNNYGAAPIILNNIIVGGNVRETGGSSYGIFNGEGAAPVVVNNIIIGGSAIANSYGVWGSGAVDINYHYNCIYSPDDTHFANITADSTNVTVNPALDFDYKLTASSPGTVTGGGIIDPFTLAGITPLDSYLLDMAGVARTPAYVKDSTLTGWSMGAYEY